ncbi:HNH endonuclease [Corynebacterium sp. 320]|uniref:HNH endonuclease n=1 Tax=Corynebacterium zhongnanshanii TaxID=2768834 RepID=A0ABQ6VC51_9CORY|nr:MULTISPECIES: HNH endonuclease signature motif containing protein [Corynebacterium]KAB1503012.1 HNH endonuclease [Corynebacterium sp. 320]KAB1550779.1 HNH endonuclease [Corynebacterium sp. 321]KAB1551136.1 HNH endonuclease [Corynebacterium sp. 319]KAB3519807.1 HNH endonuclease [Corynebacterium zhongnanshanii]KAB3526809.1 HNH endonuclease [Corynebacterium sp. 250]
MVYRPPYARAGACWILAAENDELAELGRSANRVHVQRMIAAIPAEDDYVCDHATRIAARLGLTNYQAEKLSVEAMVLARYPEVMGLLVTGHYTPQAVSKLADCLSYVPDGLEGEVEPDVLVALAPIVVNQCPLSPAQVVKRIFAVLEVHCQDALPREMKRKKPEFRVTRGEHSAEITVNLPLIEGHAIEQLVRNTAEKYHISTGEAVVRLILGQADVRITLNLFKSESGQVFANGIRLDEEDAARWEDRATHVRDLAPSETDGYTPTEAQRAFVEGRDMHCRFPGCAVPAHQCDIDHIHRYSDGGPTHTDNLHLLCRRHHRLKTAGIWDVARYPDSTEVWTSQGDGHTVSTTAEGPLARATFAERLSRKRARAQDTPADPIRPAYLDGEDLLNAEVTVLGHLQFGMPGDPEELAVFRSKLAHLYYWGETAI